MNILQWIFEHKWAITPGALQTIIDIASHGGDLSPETIAKSMHGSIWERYVDDTGSFINFSALEANDYPLMDGSRRVSVAGNVAILPVVGPLFPRANLMTMSGGSSVQSLAYDFNLALADSSIDTIILSYDTPGGEITGISDFAKMIRQGSKEKEVISFGYGFVASAGLWLAEAATTVILGDTAEMGSLGVVAAYTSTKKRDEKAGLERFEIMSSQSPNKRPDPSSEKGRAQIQITIDALADVFIRAVADFRGVTSEDVLGNFGQGAMFVAEEAVSRGMADGIGSLESLISDKRKSVSQSSISFLGGSMNLTELQTKHPELYAQVIEIGRVQGLADGKKEAVENVTTATEKARKEGAEAEIARIKAIEGIKVPGSEKIIAENKFDSTQTVESVSALILQAQQSELENIKGNVDKDGKKLADLAKGTGTDQTTEDQAEEAEAVAAIVEGMNVK